MGSRGDGLVPGCTGSWGWVAGSRVPRCMGSRGGGWAGPWVHRVMGGWAGPFPPWGVVVLHHFPLTPRPHPDACFLPHPTHRLTSSQAHKLTSSQAGTVCKCQRGGAGFPTDGDVSLRQPGGCPDLPGLRPSPVYARPLWRPAPARTGHGWFGSGNFLQISVTPWDLTINTFWTAGSHVWLFTYLFT